MRIINKVNAVTAFINLSVGDCFLYDNCLFIKINSTAKAPHNAFCFVDNATCIFKDEWQVCPVEAEIIIRSKGVQA